MESTEDTEVVITSTQHPPIHHHPLRGGNNNGAVLIDKGEGRGKVNVQGSMGQCGGHHDPMEGVEGVAIMGGEEEGPVLGGGEDETCPGIGCLDHDGEDGTTMSMNTLQGLPHSDDLPRLLPTTTTTTTTTTLHRDMP